MVQTRFTNEEAGFSAWTYDDDDFPIVYTDLAGYSSFMFLFETIEERAAFVALLLKVKEIEVD